MPSLLKENPPYEFLAPRRIVFGWGRRRELPDLARTLGKRAFLVTGSRTLAQRGAFERIAARLADVDVETIELSAVAREPLVEDVDARVAEVRRHRPSAADFVLAIGGGSAIDVGKAVAGLALDQQSESCRDYLEGIGRGLNLSGPVLPILAMPTTAGTGSETTRNAVISSTDPAAKKSLRSPALVPTIALVDPELSASTPPEVTARSGIDAITQLIESVVSKRSRPIPRALALEGLSDTAAALETAFHRPDDRPAREVMAHAAMLSGLALANSGLGMAHGVAAALGIHAGAPHGLACAVMLPVALRTNRDVCWDDLGEVGAALTGRRFPTRAAAARAAMDAVDRLLGVLKIPRRLRELGVRPEQIPDIVRSSRGNSMDGNPKPLSDRELERILLDVL